MMKSRFLNKIKFIVVAGITAFTLWCIFSFCNAGIAEEEYEKYIKVDSLNANAIIVHLASDAVTAVSTTKGIVVIDAGISISLTGKYRKIIENKFKKKDFVYLINTHSHPDHTGGNQVFYDATIVGHKNCLPEMTEYWKDKEKIKSRLLKIVGSYKKELDTLVPNSADWEESFSQMSRYQCAYSDITPDHNFTAPSLSIQDSLDLNSGDVTLNLIYFGNAHSSSDVIIHIPEMKMLMTGDLFTKYGRSSINDDNELDVERWAKVMKWIKNRWDNIDIIITGHGKILTKEDLQSFSDYVQKSSDQLLHKD